MHPLNRCLLFSLRDKNPGVTFMTSTHIFKQIRSHYQKVAKIYAWKSFACEYYYLSRGGQLHGDQYPHNSGFITEKHTRRCSIDAYSGEATYKKGVPPELIISHGSVSSLCTCQLDDK